MDPRHAEYMAMRASKDSIWPYGRIAWHFAYRDADHDDGDKTFLGETGRFNGEEIIAIIVRQEATAHFISRRLFQFFAADDIDAEGEQVIQAMMRSYFDSGYEIRAVLRTLFHSDYFKSKARYARVRPRRATRRRPTPGRQLPDTHARGASARVPDLLHGQGLPSRLGRGLA